MNEEFWQAIDKLVNESEIIVDRPVGSSHPRYPHITYAVSYGYLKNTMSQDGAGIDVWLGTEGKNVVGAVCTVDLLKRDSEIKLLVGCSKKEIEYVYGFHNESPYMKGILLLR